MDTREAIWPAPRLCVVRGEPTPEEIAAVTAVLLHLAASAPSGPAERADATPAALSPGWRRTGPHHPAGAWRTSPR